MDNIIPPCGICHQSPCECDKQKENEEDGTK